jgi:four helix bundle protein
LAEIACEVEKAAGYGVRRSRLRCDTTISTEEMYGLTSQLRRAPVAIPSNVSEGHQQGTKAYLHFVVMATGSLAEAETQLELARRLHFASEEDLAAVIHFAVHVRRVLHGLRRSLANRKSLIPDP